MFNILRCSACCRPSRTWTTFKRFLTIFEAFVPHFYLCCSHFIMPEILLNHPNSLGRGIVKLNAKFDADSLLCLLSHFDWDGHTVHMLTQWCLPQPLTSTVKSSLLTHAHSSPLSLAARLYWCCANHSLIFTMAGLFLDRSCVCLTYSSYPISTGSLAPWIPMAGPQLEENGTGHTHTDRSMTMLG